MKYLLVVMLVVFGVAGCTSTPSGPNVAVMPAPNKPFDVFESDHYLCRDFASRSIGVEPGHHEKQQVVTSAVTGAVIGGLAGAALDHGHGHGNGAAVGAGVGLLAGTAIGADRARYGNYSLQKRYDIAYMQCMYARGNQVPGYTSQGRYFTPLPPPPR